MIDEKKAESPPLGPFIPAGEFVPKISVGYKFRATYEWRDGDRGQTFTVEADSIDEAYALLKKMVCD